MFSTRFETNTLKKNSLKARIIVTLVCNSTFCFLYNLKTNVLKRTITLFLDTKRRSSVTLTTKRSRDGAVKKYTLSVIELNLIKIQIRVL